MKKSLSGTKALIRIGGKEIVFDAFYATINDSAVPEFPTLPASEKEVQEFTCKSAPNYEDDDLSEEDPAEYGDCYD